MTRLFDIPFEKACVVRQPYGFELSFAENSGIHIKQLDAMPCNFYLTAQNGIMSHMNLMNAQTIGPFSVPSLIGKTLFEINQLHDDALQAINHNSWVEQHKKLLICDETLTVDNALLRCISIKIPLWFEQKFWGTLGFSLYQNRDPVSHVLFQLTQAGFMNVQPEPTLATSTPNQYNLSKREKECLYHSIKGKSAREIAIILHLSTRTIEQYMMNIKNKLKVNSRSEMIEIGWALFHHK